MRTPIEKAPRPIRIHPDVPFTQTTHQANLYRECFLEDIRVAASDAPTEGSLADGGRTAHLRQADKGTGTFRTPCPGCLRSAPRTFSPLFQFILINAYCGLRGVPNCVSCCARASRLGGCGSFYAITIASEKLKGLPILKQHRTIKGVLKDDMAGLHGLQVCHFHPLTLHHLTNPCALVSS